MSLVYFYFINLFWIFLCGLVRHWLRCYFIVYFQLIQDIEIIRAKLRELEEKFGSKPVVVITEKVSSHTSHIHFVVCSVCSIELHIFLSLWNQIIISSWQDYDRDPEILKQLYPFRVFVLCSVLKILPYSGSTEDSFKKFLKDHLKLEWPPAH